MKLLFGYIRPHAFYFLFAYFAVIVSSITILAFGQGLYNFINAGFLSTNIEVINHSLLFLLLVVLIISISSFVRMSIASYASDKVISDIRCDLYYHTIYLSKPFFENNSISSIMSVLLTDTTALQSILSTSMSIILRNITTLLGSIIMMFHTNIKLTVYTAIIVPVIILVLMLFGKKVKLLSQKSQNKLKELVSFSEETYRGISVVQSFVQEEIMKKGFLSLITENSKLATKYNLFRATLVTFVIAAVMISIGLVLWLGVQEVFSGNMTVASLTSFIFYAALAAGSVNNMGYNANDIQNAKRISDNIGQILDNKLDIVEKVNLRRVDKLKQEILISNLTFYYPSKLHVPALDNISFSIEKGKTTALVGPSGGGKSTIINMLLRFYDPNQGSVTIDGVNIKEISLSSLRLLFSIIPQDSIIFSGTILYNIAYGLSNYTYEDVRQAADNSGILSFIESLPMKFETFVGERGLCLSEGQKQRIVIARALLRNPEVLILDEATSSLDSENEQLIQNALDKIMNDRTVLIIAHRLSTVMKANKIIVINNGKIEEIGTHKSLMSKSNSLYAKLVKLQSI